MQYHSQNTLLDSRTWIVVPRIDMGFDSFNSYVSLVEFAAQYPPLFGQNSEPALRMVMVDTLHTLGLDSM